MKIVYIECNAEEMRANRTLIDALTDAVHNIVDAFNSPVSDELEDEIRKGAEQAAGDLMGGNDTDQQSDQGE